MFIKVHKRLNL